MENNNQYVKIVEEDLFANIIKYERVVKIVEEDLFVNIKE